MQVTEPIAAVHTPVSSSALEATALPCHASAPEHDMPLYQSLVWQLTFPIIARPGSNIKLWAYLQPFGLMLKRVWCRIVL